jgi:sugar/nucleoside kinase (ribokinase family)
VSHIAVVGNLARDRVDGGPPRAGGCPFFAAQALDLLGSDGQVLTRCSDTDRGLLECVAGELRAPITVLSSEHTSGFAHVYDDEARTTTVTSLGDAWSPADALQLAADVAWVHVAPLLRGDFPSETLAAFAEGGRRVSFDAQGLVRARQLGPLLQNAEFDAETLTALSVLKLSEEEARIVARGDFDAATAESLGVRETLVTLGSHGEDVWIDGSVVHLSTTPVLDVETTGAGDAFIVAYLVARNDDIEPLEAAREASALVARMLRERKSRAERARAEGP